MIVNQHTMMFEELELKDIPELKKISDKLLNPKEKHGNHIDWENKYVKEWFDTWSDEKNILMIGSTVFHVRVLASIVNFQDRLFKKIETVLYGSDEIEQ